MFAYGATGVFWGTFAAATPAIMHLSGLDTAGFGLLLIVMTAGAVPAMIVIGQIAKRFTHGILPTCLSGFALAALALGQSSDLTGLTIALFLAGAASGASDVAMNMRVSDIERSGVTRLFNRAHAMFPLAFVVASPVVGVARENGVGTAPIFLGACAVLAAAALLAALTATGPRPSTRLDAAARSSGSVRAHGFLLLAGIIAAFGAFQEMAVQTWSAVFMESALLASAGLGSLAPAAFTAGLSAGRFTAYILERSFEALGLTLSISALGIVAFAIVAASPNPLLALLGFALAGVAVGPIEPTVYRTVTERAAGRQRGTALSAVTMVAYIGYLSSPPLLGAIAQRFGYPALWLVGAGLAVCVVVLMGVLRRTLWRHAACQAGKK